MLKHFKSSLKKYTPFLFLGGLLAVLFVIPDAFAQGPPPSVIPSDDSNIGGFGDACIGLADRIRTGDIHLRQIPCFIKYISQVLIGLAGTLSVIFVMVGGFRYTFGAGDNKEDAKHTIQYALIGLAVTLMAWIFVDIVLPFITE